jgi:pseudaminic acid cytidylyltransferase
VIVAVIPARGGSKRIPRKNIRPFAGKPIIAYSIEAARACKLFDRIIVSTDDQEIASVARAWGAETPFVRPAELSDDHTGTHAVVAHALIRAIDPAVLDAVVACCIYPTAPFVTSADLRQGYELLTNTGKSFAFSATTFAFPIQRALRILPDGGIAPFFPEWIDSRSQDLEMSYHDAGQFYWGPAAAFCSGLPVFASHSAAVILPRHRVMDIDTLEDWVQAELMFAALKTADQGRPSKDRACG